MEAVLKAPTTSSYRLQRKNVEPENLAKHCIPVGYMTGDEFERRVIEELEQKLKNNGYLE
jgi:hypothetical protein